MREGQGRWHHGRGTRSAQHPISSGFGEDTTAAQVLRVTDLTEKPGVSPFLVQGGRVVREVRVHDEVSPRAQTNTARGDHTRVPTTAC